MRGRLYKLQDFFAYLIRNLVASALPLLPGFLLVLVVSLIGLNSTLFFDIYQWVTPTTELPDGSYVEDDTESILNTLRWTFLSIFNFAINLHPTIESFLDITFWNDEFLLSYIAALVALIFFRNIAFNLVFVALFLSTLPFIVMTFTGTTLPSWSERTIEYGRWSWWLFVMRMSVIALYIWLGSAIFNLFWLAVKLPFYMIKHRGSIVGY